MGEKPEWISATVQIHYSDVIGGQEAVPERDKQPTGKKGHECAEPVLVDSAPEEAHTSSGAGCPGCGVIPWYPIGESGRCYMCWREIANERQEGNP